MFQSANDHHLGYEGVSRNPPKINCHGNGFVFFFGKLPLLSFGLNFESYP